MEQSSGEPQVDQNGPDAPSKVLIDGLPVIPSSAPFDIEQTETRPAPPPLPVPDPDPQPEPVIQPASVIQQEPVSQPDPVIQQEAVIQPAPVIAEVPEPSVGQWAAEPATAQPEALPDPTPQPEPEPEPVPEPALARAPAHAAVESAVGPELSEPATSHEPTPEPSPEPNHEPIPEPKHAVSKEARRRPPSISTETEELLPAERPVTLELPRVIAVANQKGGVGKTTTTVNLGAALAEMDYRVLVIDLDPQGNATTGLGIDARNFELSMYDVIMREAPLEDCIEPTSVKNLFVAPATIDLAGIEIELVPAFSRELKLKRAIDGVVNDFDFILIDCPPSLGLITVNGLAAAGEVLVPIQCEYYALEGLSQLLRNVKLVSSNLNESLEVSTIVLTMYDARTRLSVDVAKEVRAHFSGRVCKSVIPRTVRLSEAPSFGQPITVFDPTSRGAVAYRDLAKEVSNGATQRTR
jgi:chromosome partitioning protein